MASGYIIADLLLNAIALGIRWQELKVKLDAKRAEGLDDRALAQWLAELTEAELAKSAPSEGS